MKLTQILLITSVMIGSYSCNCHKDASKDNTTSGSSTQTSASGTQTSATGTNTSNTTTTAQNNNSSTANKTQGDTASICRLNVSFFSIGTGTDAEARPMLDKYVQQFMDATSKRIVYDAIPWGREGEMDMCFTLDNLSPEEQTRFINGMRDTFKGHELVRVEENKKKMTRRR